ncbi:MAG: hypothetical protein KJ622_06700 [Alphaproteobacteria bacterium]|nr:hypothetical protein [Alphaproteobacteria bacterium]
MVGMRPFSANGTLAFQDRLPRGAQLATPSMLLILVAIDIVFIAIHSLIWASGGAFGRRAFDIEIDQGIPELYNYLKWALSAAACAVAFVRSREQLFLVWSALFFYFLLDDSLRVHERLGTQAVLALELAPAFLVRAQDIGEVVVCAVVGALLLGLMALFYWRAGTGSSARRFTLRQLPWLGLLIFCGVIIDLVHIQIRALQSPLALHLCGIVEDGGEMIAASLLTAVSLLAAVSVRRATE